jgi:hypothetical protein
MTANVVDTHAVSVARMARAARLLGEVGRLIDCETSLSSPQANAHLLGVLDPIWQAKRQVVSALQVLNGRAP